MRCQVISMGVALLVTGCLEPNSSYRPPPDLNPVDMCPAYPAGGGGAMSRPQVFIKGGMTPVGGSTNVSYPVADFYLDVFEISVGAYRECVSAGRCAEPQSRNTDMGGNPYCNWTSSRGDRENHPINCINWKQANDFCAFVTRRLPTEAEWEYAAGGAAGMQSTYPWGKSEPVKQGAGVQLCWYRSDSTCEEGQFPRTLTGGLNCSGVADLAGGVYEWTSSEYASSYTHPAKDCNFMNSSSCSLRGGSWGSAGPAYVRAAFRDNYAPTGVNDDVGARCARTP